MTWPITKLESSALNHSAVTILLEYRCSHSSNPPLRVQREKTDRFKQVGRPLHCPDDLADDRNSSFVCKEDSCLMHQNRCWGTPTTSAEELPAFEKDSARVKPSGH